MKDAAVYAVGNGSVIAYGREMDWIQVFGSPYTIPTVFSLTPAVPVTAATERVPETNVWRHTCREGVLTDAAPRDPACLLRTWSLREPLLFTLDFHGFRADDVTALFTGGRTLCVTVPGTAPVFNTYPVGHERYLMLMLRGEGALDLTENGARLRMEGEGSLLIAVGMDFPACVAAMRAAAAVPDAQLLSAAMQEDRAFHRARLSRQPVLREHPLTAAVQQAAEAVAFQTRAQQDASGCILAGHNYHLSYVRDGYGTFRGMIACGCREEAAAFMRFYEQTFARQQYIATAQTACFDGFFHIHENDTVENTGYLMLQELLYREAYGDEEAFVRARPLMDWALEEQLRQLHHGMLPFSGDETYVAGGIVPRTMLNHGSIESTMLFRTAMVRYREACDQRGWTLPCRGELERALGEIDARFDENFRRGGHYVANSLRRTEGLEEPAFRHGLCVNFRHGQCVNKDAFGWLIRVDEGQYVCPECLAKKRMDLPVCREEYPLKSPLLMTDYIGCGLMDADIRRQAVAGYLEQFRKTGTLATNDGGNRCLGYDPGLLLYAADSCGFAADDLLAYMLSLQDEAGMWAEYYDDNRPAPGYTRCRPWESGINIEAALRYLQAQG